MVLRCFLLILMILHIIIHASGSFSWVFMCICVLCMFVFVCVNVSGMLLYMFSGVMYAYCMLLGVILHVASYGSVFIVMFVFLSIAYILVVLSSIYCIVGYIIVISPLSNSITSIVCSIVLVCPMMSVLLMHILLVLLISIMLYCGSYVVVVQYPSISFSHCCVGSIVLYSYVSVQWSVQFMV